jgi:hypothetical protein
MTPAALAPAPVVATAVRRAIEGALPITLEMLLGGGHGRGVGYDVMDLDVALVGLLGVGISVGGDNTTTTTIRAISAVTNVGGIATLRNSKDT